MLTVCVHSEATMVANGTKQYYDIVRYITRRAGGTTANFYTILGLGIRYYYEDIESKHHPYW